MRRSLAGVLLIARGHPRHLVLVALVAGLLAGPRGAPVVVVVAAGLAILADRPVLALAAVVAVLGGGVAAHARLVALDRTALRPSLGAQTTLRATLLEQPRAGKFARSALARIAAGRGRGERIVLRIGRWGQAQDAPTGAIVTATGRLRPLGRYDDYQRRRGAHAVLQVSRLRPTGAVRGGLGGLVDRVRTRAESALQNGLGAPQAALLRGMVLGQDERLTEPVRDDFRRSGLAHVLAASGQNVVLLAALTLPLLTLLGIGLHARLGVVLGLIALYVPLAGAGPPIQRAGVMGAAGIVAAIAGRPASRWYAFGLAAAATLLLNPRSVGDAGWQLSFAAVVGILALVPGVRERLVERRVPGPLAEAVGIAIAATLATAPLLAFHFGRLSLVSLPANLLGAAAVAPIMWLGMLSAAVGQLVAAPAAALNALNSYPLAYLQWLAHAAAGLPAASVPLRIGSAAALAGVYAGIALMVGARRVRRGVAGLAVALALAAGIVLLAGGGLRGGGGSATGGAGPSHGAPVASFLDVGQGDATLVQAGGHAMLIDAGPVDGPILQRLSGEGVRQLDVLVVTHGQADHEGGAAAVLRRYPVALLLDGAAGTPGAEHAGIVSAAAARRVRTVAPDAGMQLRAGPLRLDVLSPRREPAEFHAAQDPNLRAIVADLHAPGLSILLPADAESDVTGGLDLPSADVLKVAHHGSADPGLGGVLSRVRPRVAIIEVGRHNSYGHPTAQALGALHAVAHVYRTDRDGTVRVVAVDGQLRIATAR